MGRTDVVFLVEKRRATRPLEDLRRAMLAERTGRAAVVTIDDPVAMRDTRNVFTHAPEDVDVSWGAYLGTADEMLIAGPVREVDDEMRRRQP